MKEEDSPGSKQSTGTSDMHKTAWQNIELPKHLRDAMEKQAQEVAKKRDKG